GQVTSIRLGGEERNDFPEEFAVCMLSCFDKAHEISSSYVLTNHVLSIRTLKQSVFRLPDFHLRQLIQELIQVEDEVPSVNVQFLGSDLQRDAGIDAGGPARDFV